jgi:hypothetical protein
VDAELAGIAGRQLGLLRVTDLRSAGLSGSAVSRRRARGVLHLVHPSVYSLGHAALSREARWLAAVFAAGEGAALSHLSAAALLALRRYAPRTPEALVPRRHRPVPGVRLHTCRRLDPRDVTEHLGIPVTTVARTLVDLSDRLTADELANLIHEAAYRGLFSVEATFDAMTRANGRHRLARVDEAVGAYLNGSAGTRSRNEVAFLALLEHAGIPKPHVNTKVEGIEVDCHWPGTGLTVEVDGPGHRRPRTRREDVARDRRLTAMGYTVLRFTDAEIQRRPLRVLAALRGSAASPGPTAASCST